MLKLETERLDIVPLTEELMDLWLHNIGRMEQVMNCDYQAEPMSNWFSDIVAGQLRAMRLYPDDWLWNTFWFLIRRSDRKVVGSVVFKGPPDNEGIVEIGYGTGEDYRGKGYMTEAVAAVCAWALRQKGVRHVSAESAADNPVSRRILEKCGFKEISSGETVWWRL